MVLYNFINNNSCKFVKFVAEKSSTYFSITVCNKSDSKKALASGEKFVVSSPIINYDPSGHNFRATITVCSEDGVNGICLTKTIKFTP